MKIKLLKKIRYHYEINYSNDTSRWWFTSKKKCAIYSPNMVNANNLRDCVLKAIEQIYGFTNAKEIEKINTIKNKKFNYKW